MIFTFAVMYTELIETGDGSHTLFRPDLNESYHSIHGAIQESMHIFINPGITKSEKSVLRIFEVGFGTGLNVILSLIEAEKLKVSLTIDSIEKYPLSLETISKLNYPQYLPAEYKHLFHEIHEKEWNKSITINSLKLTKISQDLRSYEFQDSYDLVYFDAFSPEKEPDLWLREIFLKIYNALNIGGYLLTYSVKGQVRRDMQDIGFTVEKLPGPPGKKQILKAIKNKP